MASARTQYKMRITKLRDLTHDVRELVVETTEPAEFKFKAGQFVMLHVPQDGAKPALRAYSIASTEKQTNGFRLLFKYVKGVDGYPDGVASRYVWSLKGDETLTFTGPFGRVFFQEPPTEQIIFLNTGTGLSQHLCYLESKADQYPDLKYRLLFGVRHETDIYFEDELKSLQARLPNFTYEYVLSRPTTEWKGKIGYVQKHIKDYNYTQIPTTFYLCGNGGMIKDTKATLEADQIDKTRIHVEAFD
ncbi:MAG: phenol 2-monooxygenase [Bdellovibrionaceae bacterium]|nr:phenol 2-monooxygenase [Pseudobdellovibrionaceae bacterium]